MSELKRYSYPESKPSIHGEYFVVVDDYKSVGIYDGEGFWEDDRLLNVKYFFEPAASPVSDAGWISVTDDKKPDTGLRVEIFSPMYPIGDPMRHRIIDEQFLSISKDATHWRYLSEPFAISTPTNVQEQDELWEEVEVIFDKHTAPTGGGYEADYTDKEEFISELKSKYTITKKQ